MKGQNAASTLGRNFRRDVTKMLPEYSDVHLNVFYPYGPHALWENNLTGALVKYLYYAPRSKRLSFVLDCLKIPADSRQGDFRIMMQRSSLPKEIEQKTKKKDSYVLLLKPSRLLDEDLVQKEHSEEKSHSRPDIVLWNEKTGSLVVLEVKLWKQASRTAKNQIDAYAENFNCKKHSDVDLEDVYNWLNSLRGKATEIELFLRESLVNYLEDIDCTKTPVFRPRHLAVKDGCFVEPDLIKRRIAYFADKLAGQCEFLGEIKAKGPQLSSSENPSDCYISCRFADSKIRATLDLGFHADAEIPSLRAMSFLIDPDRGVSGIDPVLSSLDRTKKRGLQLNWEGALDCAPVGFRVIFKQSLYVQRVDQQEEWPWKYVKARSGAWESIGTTSQRSLDTLQLIDEMSGFVKENHRVRKKGTRDTGRTLSNTRWLVTFIFEIQDSVIAFDELATDKSEEILESLSRGRFKTS